MKLHFDRKLQNRIFDGRKLCNHDFNGKSWNHVFFFLQKITELCIGENCVMVILTENHESLFFLDRKTCF